MSAALSPAEIWSAWRKPIEHRIDNLSTLPDTVYVINVDESIIDEGEHVVIAWQGWMPVVNSRIGDIALSDHLWELVQ